MSESSLDAKRELTQATLSNVLPTVAAARATMLSGIAALDDESVTLADALGRVLAAPVRAGRDQPPFAISEMDGYALRASDTPGRLKLIGESAAGHGFTGAWAKGGAIRISTGAAIPNDADAVVIQEDVSRDGDALTVPAGQSRASISAPAPWIFPPVRACCQQGDGWMAWRWHWPRRRARRVAGGAAAPHHSPQWRR